jgi:hypothetical protein
MARPLVSVVVGSRDRHQRLSVLLASLRAQQIPGDQFEVIVVDDGSRRPLAPPSSESGRDGPAVRVIRHDRSRGPAAARNTGWRAAQAPLVAFTDDDCRADPGWLRALLSESGSDDELILQGRTLPDPLDGPPGPFSHTQTIGGPDELYESCNIAYPRTLLERVAGFDERYRHPCGEDVDLGWRAKKVGGRLAFCEGALVYHAITEPSLYAALRQTTRWTDAVRVLKTHPELRGMLVARCFWKRTHPPLILLLVAAAVAARGRRPAVALVGALPYALQYRGGSPGARGRTLDLLRLLPRRLATDLCELGTMVAGSLRHRTLML